MKGKLQRRMKIEELLFYGYTQEEIADKLNISVSTIYRDVKKIRSGSRQWMEDLAEKGLVSLFREALEGYRRDIIYLKELLQEEDVKNDKNLQVKIIKTISDIRNQYLMHLNASPIVWSMDVFVKKNTPQPIAMPKMRSIYGNLAN